MGKKMGKKAAECYACSDDFGQIFINNIFQIQLFVAQALNSFHRGVVGNAAYLCRWWGHWG